MHWDDLRLFLAVAEQGSLSSAARALKLSQPTVSRRIAAFEERIGARLFDRLPEGLLPTAEGAALLEPAREMARAAEAAERRRAAFTEAESGEVRISVTEVTAAFLAERLERLRAMAPRVEIELAFSHIMANLSRREADLVIRVCVPDYGTLISRKLGEVGFAVYGSKGYVARRGPFDSDLDSLVARQDWIAWDEEHQYMPGADWLARRLAGRSAHFRVNNALAMALAVRRGAGLGVLSCAAGDAEPELLRLSPPLDGVVAPLYLMVHPDLRRSPQVRAVMDALIALYREDRGALSGLPAPRVAAE